MAFVAVPFKVVEVTEIWVIIVAGATPLVNYKPFGEVTSKYPVTEGIPYWLSFIQGYDIFYIYTDIKLNIILY